MITLRGIRINSDKIVTDKESGFFEYSWSGNNSGKHFKRIRKRIRFDNKMNKAPNSIAFDNVVLKNCSNLLVTKIDKSGFTVQITGIRGSENSIEFNWKTA